MNRIIKAGTLEGLSNPLPVKLLPISVIEVRPLGRGQGRAEAVLSALDAETGLLMAREQRPDLILMDIQLPGMDGLTATRLLKQDAATRDIPVIAVTSYLAEHPEQDTRAAGCAGFIAKPYHHAELLAAVKAALA